MVSTFDFDRFGLAMLLSYHELTPLCYAAAFFERDQMRFSRAADSGALGPFPTEDPKTACGFVSDCRVS
jgi:hypothetical protein